MGWEEEESVRGMYHMCPRTINASLKLESCYHKQYGAYKYTLSIVHAAFSY